MFFFVVMLALVVVVAPVVLTLGAAKNAAIDPEGRFFEDAEQMLAVRRPLLPSRDADLVRTIH